jgi:hypothetical protein
VRAKCQFEHLKKTRLGNLNLGIEKLERCFNLMHIWLGKSDINFIDPKYQDELSSQEERAFNGDEYEFELKGKVSILAGDSGTGKSTLVDLVADLKKPLTDMVLECDLPCTALSQEPQKWDDELQSNSVLFIDDAHPFLASEDIAKIRESNCYFVIASRDAPVDYNSDNVFKIASSGNYHTLELLPDFSALQ